MMPAHMEALLETLDRCQGTLDELTTVTPPSLKGVCRSLDAVPTPDVLPTSDVLPTPDASR